MRIKKAVDHFLGREGERKLNCAQAVGAAFQDVYGVPERELAAFAACGGGRAPEGVCGAYHAADSLLKRKYPEKAGSLSAEFAAAAGSLKCRDIRMKRRLSCAGCVEKAADFLAVAES